MPDAIASPRQRANSAEERGQSGNSALPKLQGGNANVWPQVRGLYVHVPFCAKKCEYCAFYSESSQGELIQRYVHALVRELELVAAELRPRTIFFGGGTPSLLTLAQWRLILGAMERLNLLGAVEWTIESNPATVSLDKAKLWRDYGVNRVSMGVQSLDADLLERLGRVHSREMVFRSYDLLRAAGFANVNLDLMFAIPGQTLEIWRATLDEAIALGSEHLSCYEVIYEEDTPLYEQLKAGQFAVDEDLAAAMYEELIDRAAAGGFAQYEIANFGKGKGRGDGVMECWSDGVLGGAPPLDSANFHDSITPLLQQSGGVGECWSDGVLGGAPSFGFANSHHSNTPLLQQSGGAVECWSGEVVGGAPPFDPAVSQLSNTPILQNPAAPSPIPTFACRHNINYWRGGQYHGLGPSAAGYVRGVRTKNWSNTPLYCEKLEKGQRALELCEELSPLRRAGETAAFGLRMNAGWSFDEFTCVTGFDLRREWQAEMVELAVRGRAEQNAEGFRLTRAGLRFADAAAEMFLR